MSNVIAILKACKLSFVKLYEVINAGVRRVMYSETKGQAGIYCWECKVNNNAYVGRAKNLAVRLTRYFTSSRLQWEAECKNSIICKAILKYGIGNFRLFILEVLPNYNDNSEADRQLLAYREGVWVGILKPTYVIGSAEVGILKPTYVIGSAETGIGTAHNPPSLLNTANRKAAASRDKRTTFIDCYDYHTNKFLFTYEGVRPLAEAIKKVPGTVRHHLNKGTKLTGNLNGVYYELRVVRVERK